MSGAGVVPLGGGRYAVPCGRSCGHDAGRPHVVVIGADAAACDCPARTLGHRTCRHLHAVLDYLVLAPIEASTAAGPGLDPNVPPAEPAA